MDWCWLLVAGSFMHWKYHFYLHFWPVAEFTWRVLSSINRLLNNFALVSLCVMIHLCKIAILVKQFQMGEYLSQDQRKSNWITFARVPKVRKRTMDLLKQWPDCVSESFPAYGSATHLQNSSENSCFPGSAHKKKLIRTSRRTWLFEGAIAEFSWDMC